LIRDELAPAELNGRRGYRLGEVAPQRGVRLLGMYDNYLVGYRDRDEFVDPAARRDVYVGGVIKPAVLVDGRVVGVWKLVRDRQRATVELTPFLELTRPVRDALDAEAADVGRFLDMPTELKLS
jgi:hypothetical protein